MTSSVSSSAVPQRKRSRTIARVAAVQALFQCEQNGDSAETVLKEFVNFRRIAPQEHFDDGHIPDADLNLLATIVRDTVRQQDEIDKSLHDLLPESWPMNRLDPVLRALLRAALSEMIADVPTQIVINEYLDVAHGFFSGDEPKMVNGILDRFAQKNRNAE
ncbi:MULTISPECIES: transcription antitermination factor NusB [unclassified Saccharibacter]|uniref:transcription antitermination factor NusB n=1 Tax=unclassified Saccharibacter TaxID=2648722 RepID=UPI00132BF03D|nr:MULTISPECIES: transcription antitermination factor NusB [unclassified Saccharibacter]MXV35893.1 transcription antitermination factor NusB [Saccharibacter sp. EH611]MXV58013.1 transcription antitermination factor NusB [Saccharibacter sp. EH70]MXV66251.1 transcription antitermination factor NusB [Saccharibacter sp. EH60]